MREAIAKWLGENFVPGLLALGMVGVASYLTVRGQPIPEWLVGTIGTIIGFYFSNEAQRRAQS